MSFAVLSEIVLLSQEYKYIPVSSLLFAVFPERVLLSQLEAKYIPMTEGVYKKGSYIDPTTGEVMRDPFIGRVILTKVTHGMLKPGEIITIESLMDDGIVAVDGAEPQQFKKDAVLTITTSDKHLKFIDF